LASAAKRRCVASTCPNVSSQFRRPDREYLHAVSVASDVVGLCRGKTLQEKTDDREFVESILVVIYELQPTQAREQILADSAKAAGNIVDLFTRKREGNRRLRRPVKGAPLRGRAKLALDRPTRRFWDGYREMG
jgi:hypothetical protein